MSTMHGVSRNSISDGKPAMAVNRPERMRDAVAAPSMLQDAWPRWSCMLVAKLVLLFGEGGEGFSSDIDIG